jgi:polyphosphate kinase
MDFAQQLVKDITEIVIQQQSESLRILNNIESELETKKILSPKLTLLLSKKSFKRFFYPKVSP